ncbi:MAG: rhodanese-like domain-containing protein [Sphingobacteriales bacterium]|nr:rhodanese-like domain-containing protein [Sphingobacteriales bacterium]
MKQIIVSTFLLLTGSIAMCQEKTIDDVLKRLNNNSVPYIQVKDVTLSDSVVLLDAREPAEYAVSKIPGAIYVGFNEFEIDKVKKLVTDKNKKVIVYCSLGVRSEKIGHKIIRAGYNNVLNLWGGIFEWKNEGRQIVDSANQPTENIHAYSKKWGAYLKKGVKVYN